MERITGLMNLYSIQGIISELCEVALAKRKQGETLNQELEQLYTLGYIGLDALYGTSYIISDNDKENIDTLVNKIMLEPRKVPASELKKLNKYYKTYISMDALRDGGIIVINQIKQCILLIDNCGFGGEHSDKSDKADKFEQAVNEHRYNWANSKYPSGIIGELSSKIATINMYGENIIK